MRERREREPRDDTAPVVERPPEPEILALQRSAGNQAVIRMLAREGPETAVADPVAQRQRAETMLIDVSAESGDTHELPSELINPFEAEEGEPSGAETQRMPAAYIRARLADRAANAQVKDAFDAAITTILADWQQAGNEARWHVISHARRIVELLLMQFIFDPQASSIDFLGPQSSARYRQFRWHKLDYTGHGEGEAAGPNEARHREMLAEFQALYPQRRPNTGETAVLDEKESKRLPRIREYVESQTVPVPGTNHKLNRHAAEHFIEMRAAALEYRDPATGEGIELKPAGPLSFHRSFAVAKKRAEGKNRSAMARYSAHSLGLAIDLKLSRGSQRYTETSTQSMPNVIDMHESPVHKWMYVNGATYGFYRWHHEPWHFEYNPPGFPELFMREYDEWIAAQGP